MSTATYTSSAPTHILKPTNNDLARMKKIEEREKAYRGELKDPLNIGKGEPDHNVKPNRLSSIVNTGVDYLLKDSITIDVSDCDGGSDEAQADLNKAWGNPRKMMTLFIRGALSGAVGGRQMFRIIPPKTPDNASQYARLMLIDPSRLAVITDPDDMEVVTAYIIQYSIPAQDMGGASVLKRQVFQRLDENPASTEGDDVPTRWEITMYSGSDASTLKAVGEPVSWNELFPPIIGNPNLLDPHEWWGFSDIEPDIVRVQEALNLDKSHANRLAWLYSHPQPWSDIADADEIEWSPGTVIGVGPGATLGMLESKADIAGILSVIDGLMDDMDEMSAVPSVATGRIKDAKLGNLSGVAMKLMYARLVAKTLMKRLLYGETYCKLAQIHLWYAGYTNAFQIQPEIHWPDVLPTDDVAFWQTVPLKQQADISNTTIQLEAGYDPEIEQDRRAQEAQDQQDSFDQGKGPDPLAQQFGKTPLPPEMQQTMTNAANGNQPQGGNE